MKKYLRRPSSASLREQSTPSATSSRRWTETVDFARPVVDDDLLERELSVAEQREDPAACRAVHDPSPCGVLKKPTSVRTPIRPFTLCRHPSSTGGA